MTKKKTLKIRTSQPANALCYNHNQTRSLKLRTKAPANALCYNHNLTRR